MVRTRLGFGPNRFGMMAKDLQFVVFEKYMNLLAGLGSWLVFSSQWGQQKLAGLIKS
jgi:hypothetical protein